MNPVHRILVVDDDQVMRDLLEALMSLEGYEPSLAGTSDEALALLRSEPAFDLVLTDLNMPGLEGRELGDTLRSAIADSTLLIAMSGSEPTRDTLSVFDGFLIKPFEMSRLQEAIQTAGENRETQTNAPAALVPETPGPASHKVLDEAIFDSLVSMIPAAKLGELYAMTISDIGKRRERIIAAMDAGDLPAAQREAHAVKGTCGMVGATELQALAAAIEDAPAVNTTAVAEIPSACARLQRMLDSKLQSL